MGMPVSANGNQQVFAYDAYGNQITGSGLTTAADALTALLYSGELSDLASGLQYLRARFYDPASGRFNRLDDFAGSYSDPQSLHKYLYTHSDPVNGIDPSGEFFGPLLALALRGLLRGLSYGAFGAAVGAAVGAIDAGFGDRDILEAAWTGAKWGGAIGFGVGFFAPFAATFLSSSVQSVILNIGAGASITFGAVGATESYFNGNIKQGIFRLTIGFVGAYTLRYNATRPNKPINIGGEGEVPGAINLQGRWALGRGYGRTTANAGGPQGKSLGGMIAEGHEFQIYNAAFGKLPYANGSVPKVYTNNVPIDGPTGGLFPSISSAEIARVLQAGGQWIHNGLVRFTKPSG